MKSITAIVNATLDHIEQRAYERGRQDALAARAATQPDAPLTINAGAVMSTALASLLGQGERAIGATHETQIRAVAGTWESTLTVRGEHLVIAVTRTE